MSHLPDTGLRGGATGMTPSEPLASELHASAAHSQGKSAIDREVEEAMASMDPADLAEITGGISGGAVKPGGEITGVIATVSDNEILLEFGPKLQGVMPRNHFGKKEPVEVGRRVDCTIDRHDAESGMLFVSRKGAAQRATWTNLQIGMLVEGRITGVIKGGLEVDLKGIRAFMPASQCDVIPLKDTSVLLNQVGQFEVVELERRSKNVIVSRRRVMERELLAKRDQIKQELDVGQVRHGVVRRIAEFGAFVDIGGIDGLLHVRDMSWGTVNRVTDVLSVGQEIDVAILKMDDAREKISLGLKQITADPWRDVETKYPVGTRLKVRVVRIANFGAFAELESGVEALIPISEMSWSRLHNAGEAVRVGDMVDAVVIRLELDKRRLAVSMKQAQADPWEGVFEGFEKDSVVKGKVTRLADFGAFVEVAPGVEGLIHISEMSDKRVNTCRDVVDVGQEVEARILGVDRENRKISLSIKALKTPSASAHVDDGASAARSPRPAPKARKKPLRGGLSSHFNW